MSYRKLNIDGQQWQYKVGRSSVHLRGPDGKGQVIPIDRIAQPTRSQHLNHAVSLTDFKDAHHPFFLMDVPQYSVGPGDIRHWIEQRRTSASIYTNSSQKD